VTEKDTIETRGTGIGEKTTYGYEFSKDTNRFEIKMTTIVAIGPDGSAAVATYTFTYTVSLKSGNITASHPHYNLSNSSRNYNASGEGNLFEDTHSYGGTANCTILDNFIYESNDYINRLLKSSWVPYFIYSLGVLNVILVYAI